MDKTSASENESSFEAFVSWLEKSMNPDVDPREDFFGYACGRFKEENYDQSRGDYPPPTYGDCLKEILENQNIQCPLIQKVRDFHDSLPDNPTTILRDEGVIEFCGGFPAFTDSWNSENFDWIKAVAILEAVDISTILTCSISYLDDRRIILIGPEEPEEDELDSAEDTLRDAQLNEDQIFEIINDVNIIKEQFNRISPGEGDDVYYHRIRRTFDDLIDHPFDFQKYIESLSGQPLGNGDIFHLIHNWPEQFDRVLNIYASVPPRTVANYISFKALRRPTGAECWRRYLTFKYFTSVLMSLGFDMFWNELEREKRVKVSEIFKTQLKQFWEEHEIDESEFHHVMQTQDKRVLEFINSSLRREQLEEEYASLEISRDNFFQNIINVGRLGAPASFKKCSASRFDEEEIFYSAKCLLEFFIHNWKKPLMYYFSGWNVDNWDRVIGVLQLHKEPDESIPITKGFRAQINAILDYDDQEESSDPFDYWTDDYIRAVEKLNRSYNDYKFWLDQNEEEVRTQDKILSRLNLNSKTAFFVSFMQHYCYEADESRNVPILAILNCEDFAKEFKCTSDSRMCPKNKIVIKWNKKNME